MSAFGATLSTASATFTLDDRAFQKGGRRVIASMERMGQRLDKVATAARRILIVGGAALGAFVALAAKQEKAERSVEAALRATGKEVTANARMLKTQASEIQRITRFGDEFVLQLQAMALNLGASADNATEWVKAAIGMAAALGEKLNPTLIRYIALAQQGDFTMLRRYIPALRETTDATKQLAIFTDFVNKGFEQEIELAKTASGRFQQLRNVLGDLGETIGSIFTPALADASVQLAESAQAITEWIERNRDAIKVNTILAVKFLAFLVVLPKIFAALKFVVAALTSVTLAAGGLALAFVGLVPLTLVTVLSRVNQELERMKRNMREARAEGETLRGIFDQIAKAKDAGDLAGVLSGKQAALKQRQDKAVRLRTRLQDLEKLQQTGRRRREDQGRITGRVSPPGRNERLRSLEIKDLLDELSILRLVITKSQAEIRALETRIPPTREDKLAAIAKRISATDESIEKGRARQKDLREQHQALVDMPRPASDRKIRDREAAIKGFRTLLRDEFNALIKLQILLKSLQDEQDQLEKKGRAPGTSPDVTAPRAAEPRGRPTGQFLGAEALFRQIQQRVSGIDREARALRAAQETSKNTKKSADSVGKTVALLESIDAAIRSGRGVVFT